MIALEKCSGCDWSDIIHERVYKDTNSEGTIYRCADCGRELTENFRVIILPDCDLKFVQTPKNRGCRMKTNYKKQK
jgi:DNA-directed RNA polymerase subunit RPC12/RpoP